jgi:hypothetical protein
MKSATITSALRPDILTSSGFYFDYTKPRSSHFTIVDIARHLSNICRFTGAVREFYSVAQHCVLVSLIVPRHKAMKGLLHDGGEFALGDVNRPLKALLPDYRAIEGPVDVAVFEQFGLTCEKDPDIKHADMVLLATEKRDLMPRRQVLLWDADGETPLVFGEELREDWSCIDGITPLAEAIVPLPPREARVLFLNRFRELGGVV